MKCINILQVRIIDWLLHLCELLCDFYFENQAHNRIRERGVFSRPIGPSVLMSVLETGRQDSGITPVTSRFSISTHISLTVHKETAI